MKPNENNPNIHPELALERVDTPFNNLVSSFASTKVLFFLSAVVFILVASNTPKSEIYQYPPLTIGVARWRHESGPILDIQDETYTTITERLEEKMLSNVTLVEIPTALKNANDVDAVAAEFGVDVIVWGWYDEVSIRGFVDLANATQEDGLTNSLGAFLENDGSTETIRVLQVLSEFDYIEDGVFFCVPRWTP
jgi:hypothetical protein